MHSISVYHLRYISLFNYFYVLVWWLFVGCLGTIFVIGGRLLAFFDMVLQTSIVRTTAIKKLKYLNAYSEQYIFF